MRLSPALRWCLALSLLLAAVVALLPDDTAPAVPVGRAGGVAVATTTSPAPRRAASSPEPAWPVMPSRRSPWPSPASAALAAWGPPPPPPVVPASKVAEAPPVPQAPPFPYTLIGRLEDEGVSRALLSGPLRTIDARAGDLIDGQWRVVAVLPSGVELLWVPGGQRQLVSYRTTT